jgi:hypothetical protein
MPKKVTKIGVMTSGGDAPGMNAAIRAVVRTGLYHGLDVFGVTRGYNGMIDDEIFQMDSKSVANIIQRGGTILKTARSKDFFEPEGRKIAYENLKKIIKDYDLNFNEGNVIKYVARAKHKGTHIKDLEKAIDYLERELEHLRQEQSEWIENNK